jgi:hypothetical protein
LFSVIVIILGGLLTNFSDTFLGGFFNYAALGIATGLLTLLTLPAMFVYRTISEVLFPLTLHESRLALSRVRKGAFTSMIAVEIGWICKCQLVFHTNIQYDFFFLFCHNQGSSGSCGSLLVVILQLVSPLLAVAVDTPHLVRALTRLMYSSLFSFDFFNIGSAVVAACNESSAITAFGFLCWIMCKFPVPTLKRKTSKLLF